MVIVFSNFPNSAFPQDNHILLTINKAMTGIIRAAGNIGAKKACEVVLPNIFCEVVVDPVLSAVYEDVPFLNPNKNDTLEQLNQKAEFTIQHLKDNKKYQNMMISNFLRIKEGQKTILTEINKLGITQREIQQSIQSVLLYQIDIKESVDDLLDKRIKEDAQNINRTRTETLGLLYKYKNYEGKRLHLLELLNHWGVNPVKNISREQLAIANMLSESIKQINSTDVTLEKLETAKLTYIKLIVALEENIELLESLLKKTKEKKK